MALDALDELLTSHPWFGSGETVSAACAELYAILAATIANRESAFPSRLDPLRRRLVDTIIARGVDRSSAAIDALEQLQRCETMESGWATMATRTGMRIVVPSHEGLGGAILDIVLRDEIGADGPLVTPDSIALSEFEAGMMLLTEWLPNTVRSLASCVSGVGFVHAGRLGPSASMPGLPGLIVLGTPLPTTPVRTAEYILHEASHQLYYCLRDVLPVLSPSAATHVIEAPWRRTGGAGSGQDSSEWQWGVDRAMAAFHVFVCLDLFYREVSAAGYAEPSDGVSFGPKAAAMADQLETADDLLSPVGRAFTQWLGSLTIPATTPPPPLGAFLEAMKAHLGKRSWLGRSSQERRFGPEGALALRWPNDIGRAEVGIA
jgi:hypothetical protein